MSPGKWKPKTWDTPKTRARNEAEREELRRIMAAWMPDAVECFQDITVFGYTRIVDGKRAFGVRFVQ